MLASATSPTLAGDVQTVDYSGWPLYCRADAPDDVVCQLCRALDRAQDRSVCQIGRHQERLAWEDARMPDDIPDLDRFDLDAAWRVGSGLVQTCRQAHHPVVIAVWLGEQRAFHAALPGSSADNDAWVERKARIVRRFARSSHEVELELARDDVAGFLTAFGLSPAEFAPSGGAVPIVVRGALVGVLAVSGLASADDHALAVAALRAELT